jgi:hypothetical protein
MQPDSTASDSVRTIFNVSTFLAGVFPWLSTAVIAWAAKALAASKITAIIFGWEFVGKILRTASPVLNEKIGKKLEAFSSVINPALGMLLGGAFGDGGLGLAAGGLWSVLNALLKQTPAQAVKARAVAFILCAGLIASAGPTWAADAAPAKPPAKASVMTSVLPQFAVGVAEQQDFGIGVTKMRPAYMAQIGHPVLGDHLHARARVIFKPEGARWSRGAEYSLWWVF